jgi:hypothetical protein
MLAIAGFTMTAPASVVAVVEVEAEVQAGHTTMALASVATLDGFTTAVMLAVAVAAIGHIVVATVALACRGQVLMAVAVFRGITKSSFERQQICLMIRFLSRLVSTGLPIGTHVPML